MHHLYVLGARRPPAGPSADVHGQKLMQAQCVVLQASQDPAIVCWQTPQSLIVGHLDVVLTDAVSQCCNYDIQVCEHMWLLHGKDSLRETCLPHAETAACKACLARIGIANTAALPGNAVADMPKHRWKALSLTPLIFYAFQS